MREPQSLEAKRQLFEAVANRGVGILRLRRQRDADLRANEERRVQILLERTNLLADGRWSHIELARRRGKAQASCGRFESAQSIQMHQRRT